jgi:chlorophyll synthase
MLLPQVCVVALLAWWGAPVHALAVAGLILAQAALMRRFLQSPIDRALFYSGVGVPLYVSGMMVSAFALRGLGAAA